MSRADVHVQLPDAVAVRKKILLCALDSTKLMKDYEEYLDVKKKKDKLVKNLGSLMEQVKKFGAKVYEHDFGVLSGEYSVSKSKSSLKSKEEERLEDELRRIEQKLKNL